MNKLKWISFGVVGSLFAVSHIGMIGYIATREKSKIPNINVPVGPYTTYAISADENGYKLSYKANDPKTCLLYTSPSPRDGQISRMPSSA